MNSREKVPLDRVLNLLGTEQALLQSQRRRQAAVWRGEKLDYLPLLLAGGSISERKFFPSDTKALSDAESSVASQGLSQNNVNHLPEMILERDKEQRVLRSKATQTMSDAVTAQKRPGPSGSPIFKVLRRCSSAMCHRHKAFVAPCTDFKSGTPNSQPYFETAPKKG